MTDTQLALLKMTDLEKLEDKVRRGLASFVETGRALQQIEEKRGYILRNYATFAEYCEGEFHFSLRQGQRLMIAADTAAKVEKVVGEAPRNEASARVLNPIANEPKLVEKVAAQLKKSGKTIATATAEKLQEVVDKIKPQTKPMFEDAKAEQARASAKAVASVGLSDQCPKCGKTPSSYQHEKGGWWCGDCHAMVRVGALPIEIAVCTDCGAALLDDSGFCRKCGAIQ